MKKCSIHTLIYILILYLFTTSCERKLSGWGDDADIQVLADSTIWVATESTLKETFEKVIITPQNETIFTIYQGDIQKFKRYKNIIFIGTLNGEGSVSQLIKSILSPEAAQKVEQGNYVFLQKEKWASDQLIMFLVSTDEQTLIQKIMDNRDYLFALYDDYWNEVKTNQMFRTGEQYDVEKYLLETYGWMVRVQHDYDIYIEKPDSNLVMLRRHLPERWFLIYWQNVEDPSLLTKEWCISKRNQIGKSFYEGDYVEQKFAEPQIEEVDYSGRHAYKIDGLWRNDKKQAGGPFKSYCFYDEPTQRIYMLDYSIFSPRLKKDKRQYLRQAEILLQTFKTNEEITPEDIKN